MVSKAGFFLFLIFFTSYLVTLPAIAGNDDKDKRGIQEKQNHRINVNALNSPVRQKIAEFSLELPEGFVPGQAEYEIKNKDRSKKINPKFKDQQVVLSKINDKRWLAQISIELLEPGNFKIAFEVKAAKSWMQSLKDYIEAIKSAGKKKDHVEVHPNRGEYKGEAEFAISDKPVLPPDPGGAGLLTLEGVDSDNDGVRDDVQRWIFINHGDSEKTMAALAQAARSIQVELLNAFVDKTKSVEASYQVLKAIDCLKYIKGIDHGFELWKQISSQALNTDVRIRAEIRSNANFSGQSLGLRRDKKTACDFDPDSIQN